MNKELVWMALPITGLLSQIGGTWWKGARRFIIPVLSVGLLWLFTGYVEWAVIFMAIHLWAAYSLPITKFGDSIPNDWRNWLWLPFWGVFLCSSVLWLNWHYWPSCVITGLIMAILVVLSNIKQTAQWFQWKWIEMFIGMLPLFPLCFLITLQP